MFHLPFEKKQEKVDEKVKNLNKQYEGISLTANLEKNIALFKDLFKDDDTIVTREFRNRFNQAAQYCILYDQSVSKTDRINEDIIKPLMLVRMQDSGQTRLDILQGQVLMINQVEKTTNIPQIIESVTYGDTILLVDGEAEVLILNSKSFQTRAITEPSSEQILSGPREGFAESLMMNLSLIRRRIRTNDLKMKFYSFGERTKTQACICYIDSIVDKAILKELYRRLDKIKIDGVLDTNYITELIKDAGWSPFRTIGYTERPDVVVGKILEGRIAIVLDGTPVVLTLPYLFIENLQSNEDYYLNFFYTSATRIIRIICFFLTITVPGFYVATVAFHHELLPTALLISIAIERSSVPLPAAMEAFVMLIVFDILRETGIRMPSNVGQALSIVGALVIGQAAVDAKLVAAPMVIVVAITAITSLTVIKLNAPMIYIRYFLLILSSGFGYLGLVVGLTAVFIHLLNLRSFGISQLTPDNRMLPQDMKDIYIRSPWWKMKKRPRSIAADSDRLTIEGRSDHY